MKLKLKNKFLTIFMIFLIFKNVTFAQSSNRICSPYSSLSSPMSLECTSLSCTATCLPNYQFPKGDTMIKIECQGDTWKITTSNYKDFRELPTCQPTCSPTCQNNGKCIAPNKCQCTADFYGPTCKDKMCETQPPPTLNAKTSCKGIQCTATCLPGFKYKNKAVTKSLQCHNGNWVSVSKDLDLNTKCSPFCVSPCQNGGVCSAPNTCLCIPEFRGAQCQYTSDRCSIKKTGFNGSSNCAITNDEMTCTIGCPDGLEFEFTPEKTYMCKYSEGTFTPRSIPKCIDKTDENSNLRNSDDLREYQKPNLNEARSSCNSCNRHPNEGQLYTPNLQSHSQVRPISRSGYNPFECNPSCQNGGSCIFHNICACPEDYAGSQCQYNARERCSLRKLGFNGEISCIINRYEANCDISCPSGVEFEFPKANVYKCNFDTGVTTPSVIPKCVYGEGVQVYYPDNDQELDAKTYECSPQCQNGGTCIFRNLCKCPMSFRGPQCQYSVENCNFRKTGFNGSFKCSGLPDEMRCQISCPIGTLLDGPPAAYYVCKYQEGKYYPSPLPKCVYGDDGEIVQRTRHGYY